MKRVLLVDDDEVIAEIIRYYLSKKDAYEIVWAKNAGEAMSACRTPFDLILLDIKLPDVNGISLCKSLRQFTFCPILLISCIDDKETIINGLKNGADDYITKPFDCDELNARIESHLRRIALDGERKLQAKLEQPGFSVDTQLKKICRGGKEYGLTPTEYDILMFFINHEGQSVTAEELYHFIWNTECYGEIRTIVVHISNLRKKIGDGEAHMRYIHNIRGNGYYYKPESFE